MAKKKVAKKKASKKKAVKKAARIGRPEGSTSHIPKGLEVRKQVPLSRANAVNRLDGTRRLVLEVAPTNEDDGKRLEALGKLLKKKDASLFRLMDKTVKAS